MTSNNGNQQRQPKPIVPRSQPPARQEPDLAEGVSGLFRVAATSSWRTFRWAVGSTVKTSSDIVRRTLEGEPPAVVLQDTTAELRSFAWRALGLEDVAAQRGKKPKTGDPATDGNSSGGLAGAASSGITTVASGLLGSLGAFGPGGTTRPATAAFGTYDTANATEEQLYARGQELLAQSADVDVAEDGHPAYARILGELTPDEARILRFLYREGPQPAIDIRTNRPFGVGSELVADGLSMIAEYAGLRHLDRIHPYLTNLFRLGLIEFSKEPVANPNRYQVIEAQPRMTAAMKQAGRFPKIVRRSIRLNDFGKEFCQTCLFGGHAGKDDDIHLYP